MTYMNPGYDSSELEQRLVELITSHHNTMEKQAFMKKLLEGAKRIPLFSRKGTLKKNTKFNENLRLTDLWDQSIPYKAGETNLADMMLYGIPDNAKYPKIKPMLNGVSEFAHSPFNRSRSAIHLNVRKNPLTTWLHEDGHYNQFKKGNQKRYENQTRYANTAAQKEMQAAGLSTRVKVNPDYSIDSATPPWDLPLETNLSYFPQKGRPKWLTYLRMGNDAEAGLATLEHQAGMMRPLGLRPTKELIRSRKGRFLGSVAQVHGHGYPVAPKTQDASQLQNYLQEIYNDPKKMRKSVSGTIADLLFGYKYR